MSYDQTSITGLTTANDEEYQLDYTGEQVDEAIGLSLYPELKFGIDDNGVYVKYAE